VRAAKRLAVHAKRCVPLAKGVWGDEGKTRHQSLSEWSDAREGRTHSCLKVDFGASSKRFSPNRFRHQIPAGSWPNIAVRPKSGSEWSGASSGELTVSGDLSPVESRSRSLPSWTRGGAGCRATQRTGPTFGGSSWSSSLVASHKGRASGWRCGSQVHESMALGVHHVIAGPEVTRPKASE